MNCRNINLQHVLHYYTLLVKEGTHKSGSLTDHVYVKYESLQKCLADKTKIVSIYFYDHDTVKFIIQNIIVWQQSQYMCIKLIWTVKCCSKVVYDFCNLPMIYGSRIFVEQSTCSLRIAVLPNLFLY